MKKPLKISKGGQIFIPATIRRRWATATVALEDLGDRVVLTPLRTIRLPPRRVPWRMSSAISPFGSCAGVLERMTPRRKCGAGYGDLARRLRTDSFLGGPEASDAGGLIRARHYHRVNRPISLADAVLLASAGSRDSVATPDPHVLAAAQAESIATVRLPDLN